jgi:TonB family protein
MKNSFFIYVCLLCQTSFSQNSCKNVGIDYSGFCQEYHQNGKISWVKEFKNGKATGTWMYFNEKGELSKQVNTNLRKDSLALAHPLPMVEEKNYDNSFFAGDSELFFGEDIESENQNGAAQIFTFVEEEAHFNGEVKIWIQNHLVYPQTAKEMGYQGKCFVKFIVEKDGSISNISIIKGVPDCPECDKEAIRIIQNMPNWLPGKNNGREVRSWYQFPISFVLN